MKLYTAAKCTNLSKQLRSSNRAVSVQMSSPSYINNSSKDSILSEIFWHKASSWLIYICFRVFLSSIAVFSGMCYSCNYCIVRLLVFVWLCGYFLFVVRFVVCILWYGGMANDWVKTYQSISNSNNYNSH